MQRIKHARQYGKWVMAAAVCAALMLGQSWSNAAQYQRIKHLDIPDSAGDCYECHKKVTPRLAQDWLESKHGVGLMKCFVCHGNPDNKGSVPFQVNPDPQVVCRKCHEPAMKKMEQQYGIKPDCNQCHPYHQNSLHHKAYNRTESKQN